MTGPLRTVAVILLALISTAVLSGCGRKENLTPPPGADYPRQYPRQ